MLKKVIRYTQVKLGNLLFAWGIPRRSVFLVSWAIILTSRKMNNAGNLCNVLCLERSIFFDDINAMIKHSGRINYISFSRKSLLNIYNEFLGEDTILTDHNYYKYTEVDFPSIKEYRDFLGKCFKIVFKRLKINAVMSGNFVYSREQELINVCRDFDIPFVTYFKEGITSPMKYADLMQLYKDNEFNGHLALMYNEKIKRATVDLDIGVDESNSPIVGVARFDNLHMIEDNSGDGKTIILFSFTLNEKFYHLNISQNKLDEIMKWAEEFQKKVIRFAIENPEYKLIIKTKAAQHYVDYAKGLVLECAGQIPENIIVDNMSAIHELIAKVRVVAGFNSITLLESMVLNRYLLIPDFEDMLERKEWDYFYGYSNVAEYITKRSNLNDIIPKLLSKSSESNKEKVNQILEDYTFNTDGNASIRAENEILKVVNKFASCK